jgi:hypothetical protein
VRLETLRGRLLDIRSELLRGREKTRHTKG